MPAPPKTFQTINTYEPTLVHAGVDGLAVGAVAKLLVDGRGDAVADLMHRAIAEGHVAHAGMRLPKAMLLP